MQTPRPPSSDITTHIAVGLNAVVAFVDDERPKVLCVRRQKDTLGLPYGPFDPARHRTFDIGLREWVERQTSIALGYVEQLYTFGDRGREAPAAALNEAPAAGERIISVGYLALAPEPAAATPAACWRTPSATVPLTSPRCGASTAAIRRHGEACRGHARTPMGWAVIVRPLAARAAPTTGHRRRHHRRATPWATRPRPLDRDRGRRCDRRRARSPGDG